jgi:hypothetical protein
MDDTEGELRLRNELEGFYEYASSLRSLWHWIALLLALPDNKVYFHEWLMEEIPIEDGMVYCPGTITLGPIPPAFPNTSTPSERALAIAIVQCEQIYLSALTETAVDNVDRLVVALPHCEPYRSQIRLAVGRARSRWSNCRGLNWGLPIAQKTADFRRSWQEVVDVLMELFFIVDTEMHSQTGLVQSTTQPPAARGNSPTHTSTTNTSSTAATPDRETLLATMPDAWRQVYLANQYAESKAGQTLTATAAYAWLREHGFDGCELPLPDTFADYRTKAFNHLGEQRKRRRIVDTSRSVVRRSALDTTGDADD